MNLEQWRNGLLKQVDELKHVGKEVGVLSSVLYAKLEKTFGSPTSPTEYAFYAGFIESAIIIFAWLKVFKSSDGAVEGTLDVADTLCSKHRMPVITIKLAYRKGHLGFPYGHVDVHRYCLKCGVSSHSTLKLEE